MSRRLVQGVGINDADYVTVQYERYYLEGKSKQRLVWVCPFYKRWKGLLERCYSEKYHKKHPSYSGCTVTEDWKYFSKFKAWMEEQRWENNELDKDLLVDGNKVYSPETCVFVSRLVNSFIVNSKQSKGPYLVGVCFNKVLGKFQALCSQLNDKQKHLGYFDSEEDAHKAWKAEKFRLACLLANEQKDPRVAEALIKKFKE